MEPLLELKGVGIDYPDRSVIQNLDLSIHQGEMVALLGPSGCGKSTILRAIAGFAPLTTGQIKLKGQIIAKKGSGLPPEKRHIGMMFQDYALFPHLNVTDNVGFGLHKEPPIHRSSVVNNLLELVGLKGSGHRFVHELSGGQQQRVALARALAPKPELILLDEPFSNLDVDLRERLSLEVKDILKSQGTTGILVTHDQNEAFAWGEKLGVLTNGKLCQWGDPFELYHQPNNRFVANFIGQGSFIAGVVTKNNQVSTPIGLLNNPQKNRWPTGTPLDVLIRPDDVLPDEEGGVAGLKARVIRKAFKGAETLYTLELDSGETLLSLFSSHHNHTPGEQVNIRIAPTHLVAFQTNTVT